jgi:putative endonuclease
MLYLYILQCSDNTLYTGLTNNLEKRLAQHNEGYSPKAYTFSRRPLELIFVEGFDDYNLAIDWEKKVKKWSAKKKWALVNGDWEKLHELAKCQNKTRYDRKR